jgi:UDP-glucose-4-epimerase GalE
MRVLVTGGAGYIGSVIVARLAARGHDVVVYDDLFRGHAAAVPDGVPLVRGDVRDPAAVRAALEDGGCEAVVHMAALAEVGESVAEPEWYRSVNEEGTAAVVEAAVAAGAGRLVFSSTAAVYGAPERTPIDEADELAPANPYGETKLAGERLLRRARDRGELAATALRYFNACGADGVRGEDHDPESHLVPLALRAARDGTAIRVFGDDYPTPDGTCVRDYVHVADLADAHIAALEALPAVQGSFNLGTGTGDSVRAVLDAVQAVTGLPLTRETAPRRAGDPPVLVASNRRAASQLGWRPRRGLTDAVSDAWAWMLEHPEGYAG